MRGRKIPAARVEPRAQLLDRPALPAPGRHAAVDDVDDVARAVALEQAGGHRARWPEAQMTATGRAGSMPSGIAWRSW